MNGEDGYFFCSACYQSAQLRVFYRSLFQGFLHNLYSRRLFPNTNLYIGDFQVQCASTPLRCSLCQKMSHRVCSIMLYDSHFTGVSISFYLQILIQNNTSNFFCMIQLLYYSIFSKAHLAKVTHAYLQQDMFSLSYEHPHAQ